MADNKNIVKGSFDSVQIHNNISNIVKAEGTKYLHPSALLLDKAPIKVSAYYHIDREASTTSKGSMVANELIGDRSPVKYIKIYGFIMYGFVEELRKRDRNNVTGYQNIKRGASYIIGGVFEPLENSFFKVTMDNGDYLYQITSVEPIQDKDKPIYRITHMAYVSDDDQHFYDIDKQVSCEKVYVPENIGTEWDVLMDVSLYNTLINRLEAIKHLQLMYYRAFYNKDMNTLICKDRDDINKVYYSDILIEFIKKTMCLHSVELGTELQLSHETIKHRDFDYDFDDSIYGRVLNSDPLIEESRYSIRKYMKGESIFSFFEKYNYDVNIISLDLIRIEDGLNALDPKFFIKDIPYGPNSLFKDFVDAKMKISDLNKDKIKLHKFRPYDLDAYMRIPILIFLLINDTENEATTRYNHFIADLIKAI